VCCTTSTHNQINIERDIKARLRKQSSQSTSAPTECLTFLQNARLIPPQADGHSASSTATATTFIVRLTSPLHQQNRMPKVGKYGSGSTAYELQCCCSPAWACAPQGTVNTANQHCYNEVLHECKTAIVKSGVTQI
jgi:hypothetical protein